MEKKIQELFQSGEVRVINMGVESFALELKALKVPVVQMDWRPPAGGNKKMASLLAMLKDD